MSASPTPASTPAASAGPGGRGAAVHPADRQQDVGQREPDQQVLPLAEIVPRREEQREGEHQHQAAPERVAARLRVRRSDQSANASAPSSAAVTSAR